MIVESLPFTNYITADSIDLNRGKFLQTDVTNFCYKKKEKKNAQKTIPPLPLPNADILRSLLVIFRYRHHLWFYIPINFVLRAINKGRINTG